MPDESIQCVVTSPPYFGLRDYGTAKWEGGDPACKHLASQLRRGVNLAESVHSTRGGAKKVAEVPWIQYRYNCGKCGAVRIDSQIGLEATLEEYVAKMVEVFREVRRVLRSDGTLWLNLGDSYAGSWGAMSHDLNGKAKRTGSNDRPPQSFIKSKRIPRGRGGRYGGGNNSATGFKNKDLIGIPWRVALALQADGWWLRSDIIWSKPNPMPESVRDRPTKSHEYIFLLTKSAKYYYDAEAVKTPGKNPADNLRPRRVPSGWDTQPGTHGHFHRDGRADKQRGHSRPHDGFNNRWDNMTKEEQQSISANLRSVWTIATQGFKAAHFATFPIKLVEPCIKSGTSEKGCCPKCGAPWKRVNVRLEKCVETSGWKQTRKCAAARPIPCTVLDPFSGAATTGVVSLRHGRNFIGIELKEEYVAMGKRRITEDCPLFNSMD